MIPCDQVDLAGATRRAEVSRYSHVAELTQMEVRGFFPASARSLMRRPPIRGKEMFREHVQTFNDDSSESGGHHNDCLQTKERSESQDVIRVTSRGIFRTSNLKSGKLATDDHDSHVSGEEPFPISVKIRVNPWPTAWS